MQTIPNLLTLLRILLIPVIMAAFFSENSTGQRVAALCFMVACATDYLDGWMARRLSQVSKLGQFLDPMADKLLVSSTLLLLTGFGHISRYALIPAVVILCREILVSGLREVLLEIKVPLPVTFLAKGKTTLQMLALTSLMLAPVAPSSLLFKEGGEILLWIAAILTIVTGVGYVRSSVKHF